MWQRSYETEVNDVTPEQVWAVWSDINHWHEWDQGIQYAKTIQPFGVGCEFELKPKGGPKVKLAIIAAEHLRSFTDMTRFPLATMYGRHEMEPTPNGGLKMKVTMSMTGPLGFLWRKLVAEGIVRDLEADTAKIVEFARKRR